jgi:hypothetical protein
MRSFIASVGVLTDGSRFLEELRSFSGLGKRTRELMLVSFTLLALYGALMGAFGGAAQALSSAIKLPLLFLVTAAICFPTLYILNQFAGAKVTAVQYLVLVFAAITVAGLILIAFAPVAAFFLMTSSNYAFFKLLNVAILALSAFLGVRFLYSNALALSEEDKANAAVRRRILTFWVVLFAFVGSQLGWTLRPFFGSPGMPFELVREVGGNFYSDVARSIKEIFEVGEG